MCERISMFLSFTKSQCDWFSTEYRNVWWNHFKTISISTTTDKKVKRIDEHTFNYAPGVQTSSHSLPSSLHHCITSNHSEWDALLLEQKHSKDSLIYPQNADSARPAITNMSSRSSLFVSSWFLGLAWCTRVLRDLSLRSHDSCCGVELGACT